MKWIGLTGSIATGKTSVARILEKSGYPIVDADAIARQVVLPGTEGFNKIVKLFGRTIVQDSGDLDRKKLGSIIFSDINKRLELEKITHPLIQKEVAEIRKNLEEKGNKIAFYDIPLLYEKNLEKNFDAVVVVASSAQTQLDRLVSRNNLSKSQAIDRIQSQMPVSEKAGLADFLIWNDGSQQDLEYQTQEMLKKLKVALNV